jgi:hypothetical protein
LADVVHAWPVIVGVAVIMSALLLSWGNQYVSGIANGVYDERVKAEPEFASIRVELTAINSRLNEQTRNDEEIRRELQTVVSRLDQLIAIQLQED